MDNLNHIFSLSNAITKKQKKEYCNLYYDEINNMCAETILNDTIYCNWIQFNEQLNEAFDKFLEQYDKNIIYYVYFNNLTKFSKINISEEVKNIDLVKSQNLCIYLLYDKLPKNFILFDIDYKFEHNNNYNIIIIDDCMYSGHCMCGWVDEIAYNNKQSNFNFDIITTYRTENSMRELKNLKECHYYKNIILNISFYGGILEMTEKLKSVKELHANHDIFKDELGHAYPIYFDHGIGNEFATYNFIYKHTIFNIGNLTIYENIENNKRLYKKYLLDNFICKISE